MSRSDDSRAPSYGLTPSGWHDDAVRSRDAGHDEMQAEVWRHWSIDDPPFTVLSRKEQNYEFNGAFVEFPVRGSERDRWSHEIYHTGRIRSFADVAVRWISVESDEDKERRNKPPVKAYVPKFYYVFYEVKPKIYSVGATIRQCYSFSDVAQASDYKFEVRIVVYRGDPKIELLKEICPFDVVVIDRPAAVQS